MAKKKPDPQELAEIDEFYTRLTGLPADPPQRKGCRRVLLILLILVLLACVLFLLFPDLGSRLTDLMQELTTTQGAFYVKTQSF